MDQRASKFFIKAENKAGAIAAVRALDGAEEENGANGFSSRGGVVQSRHYAWVRAGFSKEHYTLTGLMDEWRWNIDVDEETGDVTDISFDGEKAGDDSILFNAIAPFVEPGSFIEMVGEDGALWRWYFDGKTCEEQDGSPAYKETPGYEAKFKVLIEDLSNLAQRYEKEAVDFGNEMSCTKAARHLTELIEKHVRWG